MKKQVKKISLGVVILGVGSLAALMSINALNASATAAPVSPQVAAKAVSDAKGSFEQAMVLRQTNLVPPAAVSAKALGLSASALTESAVPAPDATTLNSLRNTANSHLEGLFSGKALAREQVAITDGLTAQKDPTFRVLDGGVDSFVYSDSKNVDVKTVEITGTERAWSKVAQVQSGGHLVVATPSNVLQVKATMTQDNAGAWKVSQFQWSFAPGSEP